MDEPPPMRRMSSEEFEALILEVRNGAAWTFTDLVAGGALKGERNEEVREDVHAVYNAAEVALAVLHKGRYMPRRQAVQDMREILEWIDADDDDG